MKSVSRTINQSTHPRTIELVLVIFNCTNCGTEMLINILPGTFPPPQACSPECREAHTKELTRQRQARFRAKKKAQQ